VAPSIVIANAKKRARDLEQHVLLAHAAPPAPRAPPTPPEPSEPSQSIRYAYHVGPNGLELYPIETVTELLASEDWIEDVDAPLAEVVAAAQAAAARSADDSVIEHITDESSADEENAPAAEENAPAADENAPAADENEPPPPTRTPTAPRVRLLPTTPARLPPMALPLPLPRASARHSARRRRVA
jgi:hypothetical protein